MNIITNDNELCNRALSHLKNVIDPEIGLNIVDLGLLYQIDFDVAQSSVYLSMTLTTQFCPMGSSIKEGATNALQQAFPDYEVQVTLVFDPPWSSKNISAEGQKFLNY